jgi:hypothetical protein
MMSVYDKLFLKQFGIIIGIGGCILYGCNNKITNIIQKKYLNNIHKEIGIIIANYDPSLEFKNNSIKTIKKNDYEPWLFDPSNDEINKEINKLKQKFPDKNIILKTNDTYPYYSNVVIRNKNNTISIELDD